MKFTNNHRLPKCITDYIDKKNFKPPDGKLYVTQLPQSPRQRILRKRHFDEIVKDYHDELFKCFGDAWHLFMASISHPNTLTEERLKLDVNGTLLAGRLDSYESDGTLIDEKTTSVFSLIYGDKFEWESQLNIYARMLKEVNLESKKLIIRMLLYDWNRRRALYEPDYPKSKMITKEIPFWNPEVTDDYIASRVKLHMLAEDLEDDQLPECTEKERWHEDDKWAVQKQGVKKARKLCNSELEAQQYIEHSGKDREKLYIQFRLGADKKCRDYCDAAPFCNQYQKTLKGKEG